MVASGGFRDERLELMYGVIVEMSPIGNSHNWAVEQLTLLLVPLALQGRARVRIRSSVAASDDSEPAPDVLVSQWDEDPGDHPAAAVLMVEVSASCLHYDRGLYAEVHDRPRGRRSHRGPRRRAGRLRRFSGRRGLPRSVPPRERVVLHRFAHRI